MGKPRSGKMYSNEEYLEFEENAEDKHEYIDGEIYLLETAMAGGELAHARLIVELTASIARRLTKDSMGVSSEMKIRIETANVNTYPDLTIVCGEPRFYPHPKGKKLLLLNPKVIFEVLSESTELYDRGNKFEYYRMIPSLTDYVLISTDKYMIEHFERSNSDWRYSFCNDFKADLQIKNLNLKLSLAEIYGNVELAPYYNRKHLRIVR